MREIRIRTPRGLIAINPDKFFPVNKSELKKITVVIRDPWTGEGDEKLKEISEYLEMRITELKKKSRDYEDLHNSRCTDTEDPFDLEYLKKHGDLIAAICNRIDNTVKKLEKDLEYMRSL